MRRPAIFSLVLATILALGFGLLQVGRQADAAGAVLRQPLGDCANGSVTFSWEPMGGATAQRLEYTLEDNDFASGFTSVTLAADLATYTIDAPSLNTPNLWRVVTTTAAGEVASDIAAFTPCGSPRLLWGVDECRNFSSASMRFRWAPLASSNGAQWLEVAPAGNGWDGPDSQRIGPLSPAQFTLERSGYRTGQEYHFRVLFEQQDGTVLISEVGWFWPECSVDINPTIYGSDDRIAIPRVGISAPINVQDVNFSGSLGVPLGRNDAIRYNFPPFSGLQSVPGLSGTVFIGGHVDYIDGPASFWYLRSVQIGDTVEYYDGDIKYTYVVDWIADLPYDQALNAYLSASSHSILLVTCNGQFDRNLYGGYNLRRLVHAVPQ